MITIQVATEIEALPEVCFDLALDLDAHAKSAERTGESIVATTARGLLTLGDTVTFEGRHFGIRFRMTARVTEYDRPRRFVDEMVSGPFRSLRHEHRFEASESGTTMTDCMEVVAPMWWLGWVVERLLLRRHLSRFLTERGTWLKTEAERLTRLPKY